MPVPNTWKRVWWHLCLAPLFRLLNLGYYLQPHSFFILLMCFCCSSLNLLGSLTLPYHPLHLHTAAVQCSAVVFSSKSLILICGWTTQSFEFSGLITARTIYMTVYLHRFRYYMEIGVNYMILLKCEHFHAVCCSQLCESPAHSHLKTDSLAHTRAFVSC